MRILAIGLLLFVLSCSLEPKYEAPQVDVNLKEFEKGSVRVSEVSWQEFFGSYDLKRVIDIVLKNNRDLKIGDLNIGVAKKNHAIRISDLLPNINAGASYTRRKLPGSFSRFAASRQYNVNLASLSYELDFFGRLRSLKSSALEDYLASQEARKSIQLSLISEAVDSYLNLILDRELLLMLKSSVALQELRYDLIRKRYNNGVSKVTEEIAARIELENVKINYEDYKNRVLEDENQLLNLMASYDRDLLPDENIRILRVKAREELLEFVVSKTLLQRPDIQQAEHNLRSANALIGASRAAFFPSITLSGDYGYTSVEFENLFDSSTWNFMPQINVPIFNAGRNQATLDIAKLRKNVEVVKYEQVIQNAFEETLNALQLRKTLAFQTKSYGNILKSKERLLNITKKNKQYGLASKIDVLEARLGYLEAKRAYLQSEKDYFVSLVNIYKALGGGSAI
ncbi:MAG: TolC family protein [Rickettsiales bacterium]|nr:TolC family protein [Rickettsiales bacterium]